MLNDKAALLKALDLDPEMFEPLDGIEIGDEGCSPGLMLKFSPGCSVCDSCRFYSVCELKG